MIVGVLGAGLMGSGMVRSLRREGHQVRVWNRTAARAQELAEFGAVPTASVTEAVTGADAVLTMMSDAAATLSIKDEASAALGPYAVWIQSGTLGLAGIAEVARGLPAIIDAPVLGTRKPAEDGKLTALAAGDAALLERCRPVFDAIAVRTIVVGDRVGEATALKLVCNAWVALINAGTAQSIEFARSLGVKPELFLQAIDGTPSGSPYAQIKGKAMIAGDIPLSFAVDGAVKDTRLILDAAEQHGFPPDLLEAVHALYVRTSEAGHGNADIAALTAAFTPHREAQ
jgi:3-hydroxyisobutyrate dehydrogenase